MKERTSHFNPWGGDRWADIVLGRFGEPADPSLPATHAKQVAARKEASGAGFVFGTDERNATDVQFAQTNVALGEGDFGGVISVFQRGLDVFLDIAPQRSLTTFGVDIAVDFA